MIDETKNSNKETSESDNKLSEEEKTTLKSQDVVVALFILHIFFFF